MQDFARLLFCLPVNLCALLGCQEPERSGRRVIGRPIGDPEPDPPKERIGVFPVARQVGREGVGGQGDPCLWPQPGQHRLRVEPRRAHLGKRASLPRPGDRLVPSNRQVPE